LHLESLEDRTTPVTFGVPWADASRLTLSFAPDGTGLGGHSSNLFAALGAAMPQAVWQREVLRAFQTWAVNANINLAVVADAGQAPFGVPGAVQGDPRFGDIRVGAHAMSPDALAVSVPYDPFLSGTWAGDLLFNSAAGLNAATLFHVALHE